MSKKENLRDDIIEATILSCDEHIRKYGMKKMSITELKELTGAD